REPGLSNSLGRLRPPPDGSAAGGGKEGQDFELHQRTLDGREDPGYRGHRRVGATELLRVQLRAIAQPGGRATEPGRKRNEHQQREGDDAVVPARRECGRTSVHGFAAEGTGPEL